MSCSRINGWHWISSGWFTRWRVHAIRLVSVDAGDNSQTEEDRILATMVKVS